MDLYIYAIQLPTKVKGVYVQKNEGIIFVNSSLNPVEQKKAIEHELKHYYFDHTYDLRSVGEIEKEVI